MTQGDGSEPTAAVSPGFVEDWADRPCFVHFFIPLPYVLGVATGSTFRIELDDTVDWLEGAETHPTDEVRDAGVDPLVSEGNDMVSIRFFQDEKPQEINVQPLRLAMELARYSIPGLAEEKERTPRPPPRAPVDDEAVYTATALECVTPFEPYVDDDGNLDEEWSLFVAFEKVLEAIEKMLRAWRVHTADISLGPINRRTIYPVQLFRVRAVDEQGEWAAQFGFILANNGLHYAATPKAVVGFEQFQAAATVLSRRMRGDMLVASAEFQWKAGRALEVDGDTRVAVLHAETASELLLDGVLAWLAWEAKVPVEEAATWFDPTTPLSRRIARRFPPLIGGTWDARDPSSEVGRWAANVLHVRNRVAHAGYEPTLAEATDALEHSRRLLDFLIKQIVARRRTFPRTLLLLAGVPGLERRGEYSRSLREVASESDREPDWLASIQDYQDKLAEWKAEQRA